MLGIGDVLVRGAQTPNATIEHERRELERAAAIAAPLAQVVPRDRAPAATNIRNTASVAQRRRPRHARALGDRRGHARRRASTARPLEVDRLAAIRRRLDPQLLSGDARQRAGPRRARVGVVARRPLRRGRRERAHVEARRRRRAASSRSAAGWAGAGIELRRHDGQLETRRPSGSSDDQRHARHRHRRIGRRDTFADRRSAPSTAGCRDTRSAASAARRCAAARG